MIYKICKQDYYIPSDGLAEKANKALLLHRKVPSKALTKVKLTKQQPIL